MEKSPPEGWGRWELASKGGHWLRVQLERMVQRCPAWEAMIRGMVSAQGVEHLGRSGVFTEKPYYWPFLLKHWRNISVHPCQGCNQGKEMDWAPHKGRSNPSWVPAGGHLLLLCLPTRGSNDICSRAVRACRDCIRINSVCSQCSSMVRNLVGLWAKGVLCFSRTGHWVFLECFNPHFRKWPFLFVCLYASTVTDTKVTILSEAIEISCIRSIIWWI